jgi:hypothetical protein
MHKHDAVRYPLLDGTKYFMAVSTALFHYQSSLWPYKFAQDSVMVAAVFCSNNIALVV